MEDISAGVEEALDSLTWWERRAFRGTVIQASLAASNVPYTKKVVAASGFLFVVYMQVVVQLTITAAALAFTAVTLGIAEAVAKVHSLTALNVVLWVVAGLIFLWGIRRIASMRTSTRAFTAGGSRLPQLGPVLPSFRPRAPRGLAVAVAIVGLDFVAIGAILASSAASAPRVTGFVFIALSCFPFLLARFMFRTKNKPVYTNAMAPRVDTTGDSELGGQSAP